MKLTINQIILAGSFLVMALVLGLLFITGSVAYSSPGNPISTNNARHLQPYTFFSATTTNATSTTDGVSAMRIAGALKAGFLFSRGGVTNPNLGQSTFRIQVLLADGTTWHDYGRLILATSTSQTFQSSLTLQGTSSAAVGLDLRTDAFLAARCIVLETTDGEHTCTGWAEF